MLAAPSYRLPRLFISLLALVAVVAAADPKAKWVRAKTDYVDVLSDASQKEAIEFAVQYSAFRHVFAAMLGPAAQKLPVTTVLLFRDNRLIETLSPGKKGDFEKVSFRSEIDGNVLLAQSLAGDRERALQMAFEFEAMWALPRLGYYLPLWAAQGTGRVFATVKVRRGVCVFGGYDSSALEAWTRDPLPWPRFAEINQRSPEYSDTRQLGTYLSQAQTVMHRVWLEDDQGRERFAQLAALLRRSPDLAAIEAGLGIAAKDLTLQLTRHARRSAREREFPLDEAGLRARMETGAAPPVVIALQMANLFFGANQVDEADRELAAAKALAPTAAVVLEALARRELLRRDARSAVELYREAITQGSVNPRAFLFSANERLNQTSSGQVDRAGQGGIFADESIAEIRQFLKLSPGYPEAYVTLGRAFYLRPEITEEHIKEIAPGIEAGDDAGQVRFYRVLLFDRLKRYAEARADLQVLLEAPRTVPAIRQQAQQRVGEITFNETVGKVNELVAAGRFSEAQELIASRCAFGAGEAQKANYAKLTKWASDMEARQKAKQ